ncbi:MAG TPA: hypothetical protein VHZ76_09500 [Gammaproteobacteria bacterium]|jgi:hypothetical protein|nr:hypothetical protein [Gammaproteobacteria bacterium]
MENYVSLTVLAILLFGWTMIRKWHCKREKQKECLQDKIQTLKQSQVHKTNLPQNYLYTAGRTLAYYAVMPVSLWRNWLEH